MRKVCVASIQMKCSREVNENILTADRLVRAAAEKEQKLFCFLNFLRDNIFARKDDMSTTDLQNRLRIMMQ